MKFYQISAFGGLHAEADVLEEAERIAEGFAREHGVAARVEAKDAHDGHIYELYAVDPQGGFVRRTYNGRLSGWHGGSVQIGYCEWGTPPDRHAVVWKEPTE